MRNLENSVQESLELVLDSWAIKKGSNAENSKGVRGKKDHLNKMEPLSIHSHGINLQLNPLSNIGIGQMKEKFYLKMICKGRTRKYLLPKTLDIQ